MEEWKNGRMDGWMRAYVDERMMSGCVEGRKNGWMTDGCVRTCVDERMMGGCVAE
ncbi:hypothetical protein GQF01_18260 [Paenibacillus sp. 5J-6]|uniref:Uncharacterized protein n=2 Tax=Paenibacillus silvestris TaxID=2606219 RepID=A0A6L8V364_9BACL|nr:hypothetical protein [Paenibacillus silvestris]